VQVTKRPLAESRVTRMPSTADDVTTLRTSDLLHVAVSFRKGLVSSSDFFIEAQYHIAGNEACFLNGGGEFLSAEMMQRIAHQVAQLRWEVGATRVEKAKWKAMA